MTDTNTSKDNDRADREKAREPTTRQLWDLSAELTDCDWTPHPTARIELRSGGSAARYFETRGTEL